MLDKDGEHRHCSPGSATRRGARRDARSAVRTYAWNGPIAVVEDKSVAQTLVTTITARVDTETFHFKARHGLYDTHLAPEEPRTQTRSTL